MKLAAYLVQSKPSVNIFLHAFLLLSMASKSKACSTLYAHKPLVSLGNVISNHMDSSAIWE